MKMVSGRLGIPRSQIAWGRPIPRCNHVCCKLTRETGGYHRVQCDVSLALDFQPRISDLLP